MSALQDIDVCASVRPAVVATMADTNAAGADAAGADAAARAAEERKRARDVAAAEAHAAAAKDAAVRAARDAECKSRSKHFISLLNAVDKYREHHAGDELLLLTRSYTGIYDMVRGTLATRACNTHAHVAEPWLTGTPRRWPWMPRSARECKRHGGKTV